MSTQDNSNRITINGHRIRGVILDIDGTLIDSMPIWDDLGARYLRSRNVEPKQDLGQILYPMTIEEGVHYLREHYALPESEDEIRAGLMRVLDRFYREEVPLKAGALEFVTHLHTAGIPMILATIGDRELERAALTRLSVWSYFADMLLCEDYGTTKRESVIYQQCAERLGLMPQDILVVEDLLQAIRSAHAAGFVTAAVYDAASAHDYPVMQREADIAVRSLSEFTIE